ncbi:hypothetical protein BDR06DRAFT_974850 [Suillus hirtellus]|nr:hypothetical protein BDR06DRAFT_974850 [Suillus hirtellus]
MILGCKMVPITTWTTWMLAIRKYNAKVIAIVDIIEKKEANVANCLRSIAVHETLLGRLSQCPKGPNERLHQLCRVLHAGLQPKAAETYKPIQTRHAKNLILGILNDPKNHKGYLSQLKAWHKEELALHYGQLEVV